MVTRGMVWKERACERERVREFIKKNTDDGRKERGVNEGKYGLKVLINEKDLVRDLDLDLIRILNA